MCCSPEGGTVILEFEPQEPETYDLSMNQTTTSLEIEPILKPALQNMLAPNSMDSISAENSSTVVDPVQQPIICEFDLSQPSSSFSATSTSRIKRKNTSELMSQKENEIPVAISHYEDNSSNKPRK